MNTPLETATNMQRLAAAPGKSVFVSANAGSGKTRVLVERVSRILLSSTMPDKILCLTYTKAAAAEMQARLFDALGTWSIHGDDALTKTLDTLEGFAKTRSPEELGLARLLFARALETPGGLKVQTIHAFCEKLLRRFPLEAGLPPGTDAIDEREALVLHEQIWTEIETEAIADPHSKCARAITLLAAHKSDADMDELYRWMMGSSYKIDAWKDSGGVAALAETFGIASDLDVDTAKAQAWAGAPKADIKAAALDMQNGGKTDTVKAAYILSALTAPSDVMAYDLYTRMFFTQAGTPNASMVTGKAGRVALSIFGTKKSGPQSEALRMIAASERVRSAHVLALTRAVYDLAGAATEKYRALKKARRVMDFDDQIYLARRLLRDSEARDWVRYKLDGGVDHVLVDEAQDTSSAQWNIVDALSEEFFQPAPDSDPRRPRTLFAVGDEKQSIYGFQGARPELFLDKIQDLTKKQAGTPNVKMEVSFRSAAEILALVDEVFYGQGGIKEMFDDAHFPPGSDIGAHVANRIDLGLVEFWPAARAPEKPDDEIAWKPVPVDAPAAQSPREQLALQIALQIKSWLSAGEPIYCRERKAVRPMQARDIMILVTKRTDFFDGLIRNLKEQGVPVAGADRLKLTDSIAVQDLLSLAKFCLLPQDDLSLAEVLKSPLLGWDEQQLYELAHDRGAQTLWQVLPDGANKSLLRTLKTWATHRAPYEFFARTLALTPTTGGPSLHQKIYDRIGIEAADALDAFLARALAHQRRGAPSLTRFIADIEADENKIKREMDDMQNEVRVMTVHAAKGLEAPVVILPDTTQVPNTGKETFYKCGDGFAMGVPKQERPDALTAIMEDRLLELNRESMRLFYVALTRAESRLLICGFESNGKVAKGSWHEKTAQALAAMNAQDIETEFGTGLRYGGRPAEAQDAQSVINEHTNLPGWAHTLPPAEGLKTRRLSPSKLAGPEEALNIPARSPLDAKTLGRFGRGNLIHKLLQILPDIKLADRRARARHYLQGQGLGDKASAQIEDEVFAVLEHNEFARFFAEGSLAEVALAGHAKGLPAQISLNGQIDRLYVSGDDVWILDYKTNRPPPKTEDGVAQLYVRQMAAYRALAQDLYRGKTIHCALLWTDGPRLMLLSDELLDSVDWTAALPA